MSRRRRKRVVAGGAPQKSPAHEKPSAGALPCAAVSATELERRSPVRRAAQFVLLAAIVGAWTAFAHWPALSAQAHATDDAQYIDDNHLVRNPGWSSASRFLAEVLEPSTVRGYYQPLAMISLMLDYAAGGRPHDLRAFHRSNLILHVLNTMLVLLLLWGLFGRPWAAAALALLFGVHPLTVEPVVWISERKTLLATFFSLACLNLYTLSARRPRPATLGAALGAALLAMLSKPTAVPLSLLLVLLDFWPLRRLSRRTVLRCVPFFALSGVFAMITIISQSRSASVTLPQGNTAYEGLLLVCHNVVFYLSKVIWPTGLTSFYPFPEPIALSHPMILLSVIATPLIAAALVISLRWTRAFAFGAAFFFLAILPTLGVIGFTNVVAADKFVYLPSVGLLVTGGWLLGTAWQRPRGRRRGALRIACVSALIAAVLAATVTSRHYLSYWRDTEGLYQRMIRLAPRAYMLPMHLGADLHEQGRLAEAAERFRMSLRLEPGYFRARNHLAVVLARMGKVDQAVEHLRIVLRQQPDYAPGHAALGNVLAIRDDAKGAEEHFREALRLAPEHPAARIGLGNLSLQRGDLEGAVAQFEQAARLTPGDVLVQRNLGVALLRQGKPEQAIARFAKAISISPDDKDARYALATVLAEQGRWNEAIRQYQALLRLDPNHEAARRGLAAVRAQRRGG